MTPVSSKPTRAVQRQEAKVNRIKAEYEEQKKKVMDILAIRNSEKGFAMSGLDRHFLIMEESARDTLAEILFAKMCWEETRLRSSSGENLNRVPEALDYFLNTVGTIGKKTKSSKNSKKK